MGLILTVHSQELLEKMVFLSLSSSCFCFGLTLCFALCVRLPCLSLPLSDTASLSLSTLTDLCRGSWVFRPGLEVTMHCGHLKPIVLNFFQ